VLRINFVPQCFRPGFRQRRERYREEPGLGRCCGCRRRDRRNGCCRCHGWDGLFAGEYCRGSERVRKQVSVAIEVIGADGATGAAGAKARAGAGASEGAGANTLAGAGATGLTTCAGAAGAGADSAFLKLKPNSSAVCWVANGETVLTATGGLTGTGCATGVTGTGGLTGAGCAAGAAGWGGTRGRTRAATGGMGWVAGVGCWGRGGWTGTDGVPNGCARKGGWDDPTTDGGAWGGATGDCATGECVTGAWTRGAGVAGSAGALSVLVEITTLVWPPNGPGTSGGITTSFWAGRRASKVGFSRERISCKGNSTSVRSRSFSAVKVPGGADCRNSPKEIFTVPWLICERIFASARKARLPRRRFA